MNGRDKESIETEKKPSAEELNLAKRVFTSLLLAGKNLSLYPAGHTICAGSIKQFHTQLKVYQSKYGKFKFEIDRNRTVLKGQVIFSGPQAEGTLPFTLFRDGIRWMEFTDGIEMEEVQDILSIINKYAVLSSEPEGDIVTEFWETQFPHMEYEVAEFLWGGEDATGESAAALSGESGSSPLREKKLIEAETAGDPPIDPASLKLSPDEELKLQEMIRLEEDADLTSYLDALLDSLLQHQEEDNFNIVLEVLSEEFTLSLSRTEFIVTLKILKGLRYVLDICKAQLPWAVPVIKNFSINVSGPESLAPLKEVWKNLDVEQAKSLGQVLKILNPQAIHTIALLLEQPKPLPFRQILQESIISLATRDIRPLESLLNNADEKVVEKLVSVIIRLQGEQPVKHLMRLVRHPSERVRHEAVKGLLQKGSSRVKDIFNLIDDKDEGIRRLILSQLGKTRDNGVEGLLLEYLRNRKFMKDESNHVIACFRTLGQCGSSRSIPFLTESLLKGAWAPGSGKSARRRGAAAALIALGIPEADQVLKKAGRSIFPGLRGIVKNAGQKAFKEEDNHVR